MVMEFVRGETLESMVSRMGPLSAQRAAELCMQTLAALAHAHSMGVVHRDLKPANVMITENGAVKVMDFGIARVSGSEHLTNAGFMMGTPAYMAPEQVRGGEVDARADLYAMGVVFYRLTTSKLPFKGDTAFSMVQSQVNDPPTPALSFRHDLPAWVDEVVNRALEKAPDQRFQSAAEFHEAFARCLAGLPLSSMYGGDPMMTPSRAMPSGAFSRGQMAQPTPFPGMTGAQTHQPMTTGSQPTMMSPGTHSGVLAGAGDPTMLTPSAAPAITGSMTPASVALSPVVPAQKKSNLSMILALAGIVVIVGSIGAWMVLQSGAATVTPPAADARSTSTPPAGSPDQTAAGSPAVTSLPNPTAVPPGPAVPQPPGTVPAAAGSSAAGVATVAIPVPKNAGARAGATPTPTATPAAAPANAPAGAVASDPLATFPSVKFYVVAGKRATDRDVLLNFSGGQVLVMPKSGGEAIAEIPYKKILKATYTAARDPKWDNSLPGPPEGLDVGTFMRTTRHWLVVQGSDRFAVLRLDDSNFRQILEMFEARTGLKIERLK